MMYETENAGTAANTAIGFDTDDIEAEVAALRGRGVTFEEYDFPGLKTENGIATTPQFLPSVTKSQPPRVTTTTARGQGPDCRGHRVR
jgi:hypothetical protein